MTWAIYAQLGLAYENVIHGATLKPNTFNLVNSGSANGTVTLPAQPAAGTQVIVYRDLTSGLITNATKVAPGAGDTIEGTASTGINLRFQGARVTLYYDGIANWWITDYDWPSMITTVGFGQGGNNPNVTAAGDTFAIARSGNITRALASAFIVISAGVVNLDIAVQAPFFSAGSFTVNPLTCMITNAAGTELAIAAYAGSTFTLTSHQSCNPGVVMPAFNTASWNVTIDGADLSIDPTGQTFDSAAGGVYQAYVEIVLEPLALIA